MIIGLTRGRSNRSNAAAKAVGPDLTCGNSHRSNRSNQVQVQGPRSNARNRVERVGPMGSLDRPEGSIAEEASR
jgi:hypothetical protein